MFISSLVVAVNVSAAAPAAYATVPTTVVQNAVGLPDGVLYYVDGQKVSKEVAEKMNPASIAMVNVLKGATLRQIVGNVPETQVILITTKGNENAALVVELNKKLNRSVDLTNKLLLVDGQQVTLTEMERLLPSQLQQVTVLSADDAVKAYGEKGKNGSVSITTK
ncbi:hypothetical protein H9L05_06320 [Hymenobacter qilianensis]|uniref:TonB-dependent receptor plug domain-containing protein n=1 Tax=Hymenobacter qilianensis TaxID=1385715 RepID=A0A7H0GY76_9BACT|nr:hypothetical protein [Hymenobacter qilianensis]QNP53242.1 hypothetical protein H9L05_06320 [Hymenobacter qilianensis]